MLWLGAEASTLSTTVVVRCHDDTLEATAAGAVLVATTGLPRLRAVEVTAVESTDPPRRGRLTISDARGVVAAVGLPWRPAYRPRHPDPVGDWHVDRRAATAVLSQLATDVKPPFTLRLDIRGRPLEAVTLRFTGPPTQEVRLRRGLINDDLSFAAPDTAIPIRSVPLPPRIGERLLALLATVLHGLAGACGLIAMAALAATVRPRRWSELPAGGALSPRAWWLGVLGLATLAVARSAWVATVVLERVPHVPDGVAYLLQARWLLAGWLVAPAPPLASHFEIPFTFVRHGLWYSQYPPAWPAVLAAGDAIGAAWLVAPVLGGLFTVLVALLGRELDRPSVGLLAALLAAISPLATLLFASYLSHAAAAPLVAAFLWLTVAADRRGRPHLAAGAGLALGLAAGMRPLTAVAVAIPIGLLLVVDLVDRGRRHSAARRTAWLVAGGLVGLAPTLTANALVTGAPLRFAYSLANPSSFYGLDRVAWGVRNLDATVASLPPQLLGLGWGLLPVTAVSALALGLVLVPLLRRRPARGHRLLAAVYVAVAVAYVGTQWNGLHGYGARYHFEAVAALLVLAAAGLVRLTELESRPAPGTDHRPGPPVTTSIIGLLIVLAIVLLPFRMALYDRYNLVDGALVAALRRLPPEPALVIFKSSLWYDWGRAAPLLPPFPAGGLVFAAEAGDLIELVDAYPDHHPYLWNGNRLASLE